MTNTKLTYLKKAAPLSLSLMAFVSSQALAQELVEDGDFQSTELNNEIIEATTSKTWALKGDARLVDPSSELFADEDKYGNVAYTPSGGVVSQNLGITLQPNKVYTFNMDVGWAKGTVLSDYQVLFSFIGETKIYFELAGEPEKEGSMVKATGSISTVDEYQQAIDSELNILLELHNLGPTGSKVFFDNVSVVAADVFSDNDGDGMPNNWEMQYGFDPGDPADANEDADSDGATNLAEFNAQTNPRDGSDFPDEYAYVNKGNTRIEGAMRLLPQTDAPFECNADHTGAMYFDSTLQQTLICDGTNWNEFQGAQGEQGDTGEQGVPGEKGDTGEQGIQGIQGLKGDKGDKGDTGEQGIQGLKGDKGDKGDTGEQGIQGIQGLKGDKGDKGDTGEQGIQGIQGETGEQGIQGIQGETGEQGPPGVSAWVDGNNNVSTSVSVGIGNTSPEAALDVAGNVIANDPMANNHLTTKAYVDTQIASAAAKTCVPTQISSFPETSGDVSVSGSGYVTGLSYVEATNGSRSSLFRGATVTVDGLSGRVNPTITSTWVNAPGDQLLNGLAPMNSRFNSGFSFSADWSINGSQFSETMVVVYYCLEQ